MSANISTITLAVADRISRDVEARNRFATDAQMGLYSNGDISRVLVAVVGRLNAAELLREQRDGPCQCASCLGRNGWMAPCLGHIS